MQDVAEVAQEKREQIYTSVVTSSRFKQCRKAYTQYHTEGQQKLFRINKESAAAPEYEAMLKIRWGTQKVIVLKQEEPSWKRRSMKITSPMGNAYSIYAQVMDGDDDHRHGDGGTNGIQRRLSGKKSGGDLNDNEEDPELLAELQRRNQLKRRTMSFSGHQYSTKTSAFRPKYGTTSSLRVTSKQTTMDVIKMLLKKFAVENDSNEFNLFSVLPSGETHEFKLTDFPLLKRIELGPDDDRFAKIFIMERRTQEISLEVAQYLNMQEAVMQAILRKFDEEEEHFEQKIRDRYSTYRATLEKKLAALPPPLPPKPQNLIDKYRNRPPLPPKTYKLVGHNIFRRRRTSVPPPLPPRAHVPMRRPSVI